MKKFLAVLGLAAVGAVGCSTAAVDACVDRRLELDEEKAAMVAEYLRVGVPEANAKALADAHIDVDEETAACLAGA